MSTHEPPMAEEKSEGLPLATPPESLSAVEEAQPKAISGTPLLPPEEGLRGWLVCLGGFFCLMASFGFLNIIGIFQSTYQTGSLSSYTPSDISWIFTLQLSLMWAPGPLYGRIIDTYGPAPLLWPGSFLCVFGLCMTSLSTEYYQIFLAQGLAFGIGAGAVFTASAVCVSQWFVRRRGLAVGLATTGSSLGGVIFPPFFLKVQDQVGFPGAIRYLALFIGILLAAGIVLIKPRLPRKKWDRKTKWFDVTLFKQASFTFLTLGSFLGMWGLFAPFDFITSSAMDSGFSPDLAIYLISILNATSVFGRIIPPYLGDTLGHLNVVTLAAFFSGGSILTLWLPFGFHHSHAGLIVFALVYGFVSGSFVSLLIPCVAKTGDISTIGQRFGTFQLVLSVSLLTGLPIEGAILALQGETVYWGLQTHAIISLLLGSGMIGASAYLSGKKAGTWRV